MDREASPSNEQAFFDSSRAFLSTASTATSWRRLRLRICCFVLRRWRGGPSLSSRVAVEPRRRRLGVDAGHPRRDRRELAQLHAIDATSFP